MTNYKINRYIFYEEKGNKCVILNLFNGAIILLEQQEKENFNNILNKKNINIEEIDSSIFNILDQNKVIVPVDFDEQKEVLNRHKAQLNNSQKLHLTIFVTEDCNFNCNYCFVDKNNAFTIKIKTLDNILGMIKKHVSEFKCKEISISWFGGEPLLAIEEIKYFTNDINDYTNKNKIDIKYSLVSNGYLLSLQDFIKLYEMGIKTIQITFDGNKDSHDKIRRDKHNGDTFDKILENLIVIKQRCVYDFTIVVRCNFLKNEINDSVDDFIEVFIKEFSNDTRFHLELQPIIEYDKWGCDNNELNTYIGTMSYMLKKTQKYPILQKNLFKMILPKNIWCPVRNLYNLTINTAGEIYFCDAVISSKNYQIGNVELNKCISKYKDKIIDEEFFNQKCLECNKLPICLGSCYLIKHRYNKNACYCSNKELKECLMYFLELDKYE